MKIGEFYRLRSSFEEVNAWNLAATLGMLENHFPVCCTEHQDKNITFEIVDSQNAPYSLSGIEKYFCTIYVVRLNICDKLHCVILDEMDCTPYVIGKLKAAKKNK